MCRVLEVSAAGYYAWLKRPESKRAQDDALLLRHIRTIHLASRESYGVPRVYRELRAQGIVAGRDRVARLMRAAGLRGITRRRFVTTTRRDERARPAPDLVERQFRADGKDQLWVADLTYIPTWAGFLYLAMVLDVWSRRVVGWAMASHLRTELVLEALKMAVLQRRPKGVIHHSDQGCQLGFKGSSQHLAKGSCDGEEKVSSIRLGVASTDNVTRPADGRPARASTAVLGGDRPRLVKRSGWNSGRGVSRCRNTMVSREWRDGSLSIRSPLRTLLVVRRTRRDRSFLCPRPRSA